jgi:hypothetical protein
MLNIIMLNIILVFRFRQNTRHADEQIDLADTNYHAACQRQGFDVCYLDI